MSDADLLAIFWIEVSEHLETLNNGLLQLEMLSQEDAANFDSLVREMNRVAHSMKGAARAVGIGVIETISHNMEEVFDQVLKGKLHLTPDSCDTLYDGLDLIQNVADGEENDPEAVDNVMARLTALTSPDAKPAPKRRSTATESHEVPVVRIDDDEDDDDDDAPAGSVKPAEEPAPPIPESQKTRVQPQIETSTVVIRPVEETVRVTVSKLDRLMAEATELFVARMHGEQQQKTIQGLRRLHSRWQREWRGVRGMYIRLVRRMQDRQDESAELATLIKFLELNQRYMSEMGREMAQLAQAVAGHNTHFSALADQLQDEISAMRLIPFEAIVGGFQRMVRDLARDMDKQIHLDVSGMGVEIDKTVLEALKDPLMHLLRNAIDHGIESPKDRTRAGKPPVARINLSVEQRGSEIILRVSDDGRGIDPDKLRRTIVKRGLLSEAEAASLSDDEARSYVFHSGLSTSDKVTSVSGRGLGMDIVRDRVESLRGRVSLHSVVGQSTTITINMPVSLTRIRCVMLRVGDEDFAVSSATVVRMDKVERSIVFTAEGREMVMVNERPVPLASMGAVLDVPSLNADEDLLQVLTLQATDRMVAFEVDELYSEEELVLKPLGPELARAPYVAGAALLGTGEVIIVLDANDLVRRATGATLPHRSAAYVLPSLGQRRLRVLVVDDSITTRTLEKNILETAGFDVHVAMNGLEAWEMLAETEFDIVISDVEMPRMTGLELTARIKSSSLYRHIPVILLTSLAKPEQREAGLRAGADAYLVKSRFDQNELLQTIQTVV